MKFTDLIRLVLLGALWGASFLFMRVAAPEFGPVPLVELRVLVAALFLMPVLALMNGLRQLVVHAMPLFIVGLTNAAIPACLVAFATLSITAGLTAILSATAPFFAAIVAYVWLKEPLFFSRIVGLVIGFCGVVVLVWGKVSFKTGGMGLAVAAMLAASLLYGIAANYMRKHLPAMNALVAATGSQIGAAIFLMPFALWSLPQAPPSAAAWTAAVSLGILSTGVAYFLYFRLVTNLGATRAVAVTFLNPMFGMLWGMLVLDESITLNMAVGTAIILAGTALTTGFIALPKKA